MEDTLVINIDGIVCIVKGDYEKLLEEGKKFEKDCGYVKDGHVFIYGGKIKEKSEPGHFYKTGDGKYTFVKSLSPDDNTVDKIKDIKKIKEDICNPDRMKDMGDIDNDVADLHVFAPAIKDGDDHLKKLVKLVLADMQIDLKQLRSKFSKEYDLTNLKASVTKSAPMTMKFFLRWLEVLDLQCVMTIDSKNKNSVDGLEEPITLTIE